MVGSVKLEKITYKHGDLVFAKVRGYPPWPARIDETVIPGIKIAKNKIPVFFFGTHETGMMAPKDLFPYLEHKKTLGTPKQNRRGFNDAMLEIENKPDLTFVPKSKMNEEDADSNSNDTMPARKRVRRDSNSSQSTTKSKGKTITKTTSTMAAQRSSARRSTRLSRSVKGDSDDGSGGEEMDIEETSDNKSEDSEWKPVRGKRKRELDTESIKGNVNDDAASPTLDSSQKPPVPSIIQIPMYEESVFQEDQKTNGYVKNEKEEHAVEENNDLAETKQENGRTEEIEMSSDVKMMDVQETPEDLDESCNSSNTKQNDKEQQQQEDKEKMMNDKDLEKNDDEQVTNDKGMENNDKDLLNSGKGPLKDGEGENEAMIENTNSNETLTKNSFVEVTKSRHPVPLKQQIETGEFIPDDNLAGKLQKKLAEKEVEKERKKKEKYAKKKQDKMLLIRTEVKLRYLDMKIKESLSVKGQDIDKCICAMDKLVALPITPLMLKKNPDVVLTIRKCCKFKNSGIVRMKAEYVYNTFKMLFMVPEGQSFWQTFQNETKRLEEAAVKMGKQLSDMTEDINSETTTEKLDEGLKSSEQREAPKLMIETQKSNGECFSAGDRVVEVCKGEQPGEDNETTAAAMDTSDKQQEKSEVPNSLCCTF